jgi:transcription initiation factor TFIIIB Brf1 subunit/transcription initiation factor TFIIB
MFKNSKPAGSGNDCSHPRSIDDPTEGTCVCIDCGLVLDQLYFENYNFQNERHDFSEIFLFIKDVCGNACLPDNIISYTHTYFKKLKSDSYINERKFSDKTIASYALYETLSRHKLPYTANEIEYFTGTACKLLWKVEDCLHFTEMLNNPQDFVDRYCSSLDIDFYNSKIIKGIVGNMYGLGDIRPSCVVAAVIYLYCKEIKLQMSMKAVCEACFVSTGNMYKIIRRLPDNIANQISLLYT